MHVLISTSTFAEVGRRPLELLEARGYRITLNPHRRQLTEEESKALLADVDGLIAGTEKLTAEVLEKAPALKVVSRVGTGVDAVDLQAARTRGIPVFNTPEAHVDAVAELVLGGMLATLRRIGASDRAIRRGEWRKPMGSLLRGKSVGIVGLGRVGKALVKLLGPFGVAIVAHDPVVDDAFARAHGIECVTLEALCARADVLSLNLSFSSSARHILSADLIARLKASAVVVNCARGGLVDEAALADFLRKNPEAGAYIDTFESEPYHGPLIELDNVLLSAHVGSYAREARERMELDAVENLLRGLDGARGNVA
jgi:D-3-phosphoglycerate dehydrogenase / 2-oxoglutarate reductase